MTDPPLSPDGRPAERIFSGAALPDALAAKAAAGARITVALPALDEAATIGPICRAIHTDLMKNSEFVDELIVVDSGSRDETRDIARSEGATVFETSSVLPSHPSPPMRGGKGEALWKSLAVATGDIVVWLDSDVTNFRSGYVTGLATPLLRHPELLLAKAFYRRPIVREGTVVEDGARVTELLVRPLLNLLYPALSSFVQPLAGETAVVRDAVLQVPLATGYAIEAVLLVDMAERFGIGSLCQVDLDVRTHRNRDLQSLGQMSAQIARALLMRLEDLGAMKLPDEVAELLVQFENGAIPVTSDIGAEMLPPMATLL